MQKPSIAFTLFLSLCLPLCLTWAAIGADWNQWRGTNRDGSAPASPSLLETLPEDGLAPLWKTAERVEGGGNGGWSSPLVAEGKVYLFSHSHKARPAVKLPPEKFPPLTDERRAEMEKEQIAKYEADRAVEQKDRRDRQYQYTETLNCWDAATGEHVWRQERDSIASDYSMSSTPAVVAGRVYALGADRQLVCRDAANGEQVWVSALPVEHSEQTLSSSVAVGDGVVAVQAGDLVAVDAESGKVLWKGEEGRMRGHDASPVFWNSGSGTLIVANVNGNETVCVQPRTGREVWRVQSHAHRSTPVIAGNRLITLGESRKGGLRCFEITESEATPAWTYQGVADPGSSPVVCNDQVFAQGENRLVCVDLKTGEPAWSMTLDLAQPRYTSLIAVDGKVLYTFGGVFCLAATADEPKVLLDAKLDDQGRLTSTETLRAKLQLSEKPSQEAEKIWQERVVNHGPLTCSSPAVADGRLYLRLPGGLVCYDLRQQPQVSSE